MIKRTAKFSFMEQWKEYKLEETTDFVAGFAFKSKHFGIYKDKVVKIKDIQPPIVSLESTEGVDLSKYDKVKLNKYIVKQNDFLLAMTGATIGKIGKYMNDKPAYINQRVLKFIPKQEFDFDFIYYSLLSTNFQRYINNHIDSDSAQPNISASTIGKYTFKAPCRKTQHLIATILKSLDDKIELNRRINDNLEQQAQALFNHYFIENTESLGEYEEVSLLDIATYTNGLAMQKYRPSENETSFLPVLKIKELGQGFTDSNSDICTYNIPNIYIINSGDIIFSWSGTLMVRIWCGEMVGLNQHLFKVSSDSYEKWFYYFWTKYHLRKFINIANDKAVTMGHIRREDLAKSKVILPNHTTLQNLNKIFSPILDSIINNEIESKRQSQLRDTLLPRLMSGELKINDLNC